MRKLKSIDAIYNEVKDCSFVLTNDAPLATALNKLVDKPMVGAFAMTPRQVAVACSIDVKGSPIWGELKVVTSICKDYPVLDLRFVHGEVQKIVEIRQYTKDVGKHLFTESSKKVYDSWKRLPTVESVMDAFDPSTVFYPDIKGRIAVVGIDMFNDLDKCMIPPNFDYLDVEIFVDEATYIPEIYQIGNDRQLAENAVALIEDKDPNDFAIVMNTSSPIVDSVKTALYRRGIPFINSLKVRDLNQIRDYLQFNQLSLSYETLRVKHVKEIFSSLGAHFDSEEDEHLLDKVILEGKAAELRDLMKTIRAHTFDEVRKAVCSLRASSSVKIVLDDLEISDKKVSTRLVERMNYSVDNISDLHHNEQIPDYEKMGVLLADSRNSVYIDRPIVIYMGMSDDWDLDLADKKYVDNVQDEMERMSAKLEALVQQGVGRYYLVNTSRGGKPARPTVLFSGLFEAKGDNEALEFGDLLPPGQKTKKERWCDFLKGEPRDLDDRLPNAKPCDKDFSQSGFKAYFECPYSFQFKSTIGSKDADYFEFGNLIHQFAELYFSHPDVVEDRFDELVQMAAERFSGISSPALGEIDAGRIRCGMTNIRRYIDSLDFKGDRKISVPERSHENFFYEALGIKDTSELCEADPHSGHHMIHGKMDLNAGTVIDYKTGKLVSGKKIREKLSLDGVRKDIDVQAAFYLAIANEKWSGKEMQFLYAMGNDTDCMDESFDIAGNIRKVYLYDFTDDYDISGYIAEAYRKGNGTKCEREPMKMVQVMAEFMNQPLDGWASNEAIVSKVADAFDYKPAEREKVVNSIKKYADVYRSGIFASETTVVITRQKLESMLMKIDNLHAKMMEETISELPPDHDKDCRKCDYFQVCTKDKVIISEGGDSDE